MASRPFRRAPPNKSAPKTGEKLGACGAKRARTASSTMRYAIVTSRSDLIPLYRSVLDLAIKRQLHSAGKLNRTPARKFRCDAGKPRDSSYFWLRKLLSRP